MKITVDDGDLLFTDIKIEFDCAVKNDYNECITKL